MGHELEGNRLIASRDRGTHHLVNPVVVDVYSRRAIDSHTWNIWICCCMAKKGVSWSIIEEAQTVLPSHGIQHTDGVLEFEADQSNFLPTYMKNVKFHP